MAKVKVAPFTSKLDAAQMETKGIVLSHNAELSNFSSREEKHMNLGFMLVNGSQRSDLCLLSCQTIELGGQILTA